MTDKLLREAAQNILNGIETGAIKIETDQDESWANALSALRSALAQSESEPDKLEKAARAIYDMMPFDGVGSEKKPAWVEGGNSLKQDEARRYARAALAEAQQGEAGPSIVRTLIATRGLSITGATLMVGNTFNAKPVTAPERCHEVPQKACCYRGVAVQ
jgi:hypothetical protein